ncbi:MAG TPA: lysylphosphatidylglycerol synthase transmembrane domain-containing protein [Solirubrobacteraceae bacterium]|nr:lysylphosphatidylglycerol synthase transmembrane domain-containing protein [Solirubrobacteraceae bacterium]
MDTKVTPQDGAAPRAADDGDDHDEAMPRVQLTRRTVVILCVLLAATIAFMIVVAPQLGDIEEKGKRVSQGDPWWLAVALAFTVLSFGGYVAMFRGVFVGHSTRIDLSASYQITMAGLAATRLLAAGGAGGIALTAWALRRAGMDRRRVADKTLAFLILTYAVYMAALVVVGFGLYFGVLGGRAPFGITVVPAILGLLIIAVGLGLARVPPDLQRRLEGFAQRGGRLARWAQRLAHAPAAFSSGMREAVFHARRRDPALLGAIAYWGFSIATLWACFHAFGDPPPWAVIVMAYFVGFLGNLLPLPGGIGGVDGGMIGAFLAFDVDGKLTVLAVLSFRVLAFWLPTIPGAIAYFQLRRTVARWDEERRAHGDLPATASA